MFQERRSSNVYMAIPFGENEKVDSVAIAELDALGSIAQITTGEQSHRTEMNVKAMVNSFPKDTVCRAAITGVDLAAAWSLSRNPHFCDARRILDTEFENSWLHWVFQYNAERILNCKPDESQIEQNELYRNVFGYLFAKAIELEHIRTLDSKNLVCIYEPKDAWNGILQTSLNAEKHTKLEYEHARGRGYYDYYRYSYSYECENHFIPIGWSIVQEAPDILVRLQHIGQAYARDLMDNH